MSWQVGLYVAAVLIPLAAFTVEFVLGRVLKRLNAYLATAAIGLAFVLSLVGFVDYFFVEAHGVFAEHAATPEAAVGEHPPEPAAAEAPHGPVVWKASFNWVTLGTTAPPTSGQPLKGVSVPLGVYIDNLTVIMFLMVTFIATLIHLYSMGYMSADPRYPLFFTYLSLFCFSMLGLVASANIFMIFIFWELVGVCSYLLIGFWYEEKKNADAANKAFITNRVGDVGMLVGMGLLWTSLGTFSIADINAGLADGRLRSRETGQITRATTGDTVTVQIADSNAEGAAAQVKTAHALPYWVLTIAGLGVFAGCVGKSAQFPLHVWLPDAMAGPTPVSALIHAATMVAAGVYLVGRFYPLFNEEVLLYIAYTGGITLFIAATIATVQTDYKKVLAYSTVSQLGYMMLGLGVGGWAAGLFHLLTHACFKALLFLGAGSVYHSVHTYEMPVLGGLRRRMPITAYTMLAATLAISGVPFFSGFYSKDAILASALYTATHGEWWNWPPFVIAVIGASITAFYMFRMWFLVFDGTPRGYPAAEAHGHDHGHSHGHEAHHGNPYDHAHESPPLMTLPLVLLAIPTVFVGWTVWVGIPVVEPVLEQLLAYGSPLPVLHVGSAHWIAIIVSLLVAAAGIGGAAAFYSARWKTYDAGHVVARFPRIHSFLVHKWRFDELYHLALVKPTLTMARACSQFDRLVVDGAVNGAARLTELLSRLEGLFDKVAVDGLVNLVAHAVYVVGDWGRSIQTGRLRNYLMFLAVALVGLFAGVFAWINS